MALAEIHPETVSDMYLLHTHTYTHTHTFRVYIYIYYININIDIDIDIDRQIVSIFLVFQAVDSINQARFATAFAAFQLLLPGRGALNTNHTQRERERSQYSLQTRVKDTQRHTKWT